MVNHNYNLNALKLLSQPKAHLRYTKPSHNFRELEKPCYEWITSLSEQVHRMLHLRWSTSVTTLNHITPGTVFPSWWIVWGSLKHKCSRGLSLNSIELLLLSFVIQL